MAADTASLPEQIFTFIDGLPLHIAARQHHVGRVASLTTGFNILLGEKRPQPVFVVAVRLFNARGGASIALVAG